MKIKYEYGMNLKSKFRVANMNNYGFPASILELPYENDNFRMLLILPKESTNSTGELNLNDLNYEQLDQRLGKN